jgi:hypothetical protein
MLTRGQTLRRPLDDPLRFDVFDQGRSSSPAIAVSLAFSIRFSALV